MKKIKFLLALLFVFVLTFSAAGCDWSQDSPDSEKQYTLAYVDNSKIHTVTVRYGEIYSIDDIPKRDGYDFLGLFDAEEGGAQYIDADGLSISAFRDREDKRLFCHWTPQVYILQLNYGNAPYAGIDRIEITYDGEIQGLPESFYVEGSEFIGWYSTQDASGIRFANGTVMNKSLAALADENNRIALHAIFDTAKYTVHFYSQDGNSLIEEKQVAHGTDISEVAPKTLSDGSEIISWSTSKNGYGYEYHGEITAEMNLYVRDFRYVLTLDYGYNNQKDIIRVNQGKSCQLPHISRERYIFAGWYEGGLKVNDDYTPQRSTTLTAHWTANFYTVSFNTNGGSSVTINLPSTSREGYTFNYWRTSSGTRVDSPYRPTGDITLYADWTAQKYTVSFQLDGGSMKEGSQQVTYGSSCALPVPTKTNCTFDGWYTNTGAKISDGRGYVNSWTRASDTTLFAHWALNALSARFEEATRHKITESDTTNYADTIDLKNLFGYSVRDLIAQGYTKLHWKMTITSSEVDDGYQEFFVALGKSYAATILWSKTDYEHSPGKKDTTKRDVVFEFDIDLRAVPTDLVYVLYGAHGEKNDDWYREKVSVEFTLT